MSLLRRQAPHEKDRGHLSEFVAWGEGEPVEVDTAAHHVELVPLGRIRYSHELRAGKVAYAYNVARRLGLSAERRVALVHEVLVAVDCEAPCPPSTRLVAELARQPSDGRRSQPEVRVEVRHPEPAAVVPREERLAGLEHAPHRRLEIKRRADSSPQRPGHP